MFIHSQEVVPQYKEGCIPIEHRCRQEGAKLKWINLIEVTKDSKTEYKDEEGYIWAKEGRTVYWRRIGRRNIKRRTKRKHRQNESRRRGRGKNWRVMKKNKEEWTKLYGMEKFDKKWKKVRQNGKNETE